MSIVIHPSRVAALAAIAIGLNSFAATAADKNHSALKKINHFVVIYQENHSFDNLYGKWEGVDGLNNANILQVDEQGNAFKCLPQNDVNLASPEPLAITCTDHEHGHTIDSHFSNAPFPIDEFIKAGDETCPKPGEHSGKGIAKGEGKKGGCTRDLVHRFYQEQYQLNDGKMDRYVAGSDAAGLTMGYYETTKLPLYHYLHRKGHANYVIADNFFQAAFGGSFLNHQWLIAARTPEWSDAVNDGSPLDQHSVIDSNGMPVSHGDHSLTASCTPVQDHTPVPAGSLCGNFAINTIQAMAWPYRPKTADGKRLPPQTHPTIGDRLTASGIDWAWYSGGWANAEGDTKSVGYNDNDGSACSEKSMAGSTWPKCPDRLFQFHHQPFNYFANYAPGSQARSRHLRDEEEFKGILKQRSKHHQCTLKPVSFVKPLGSENEHPGYASESRGNDHLVSLLKLIEESPCAKDTMVIVTYDEFGGQADHVAPPSAGNGKGPYDVWGPGTRIPALIIAPQLRHEFAVDHVPHDTTSILATLEHRFGLTPLSSRDGAVRDLSTIFDAKKANSEAHHH